jgi:hypothetical protein
MRPDFVLCYGFTNDLLQVVLIEKTHPEPLAGKLNGVGGHVEAKHENELITCVEEVRGETGVKSHVLDWKPVTSFKNTNGKLVAVFCTNDDIFRMAKTTPQEDPTKTEKVFVLNVSDILQKPNSLKLLPEVQGHVEQSLIVLRRESLAVA